MPDNMYWTKYTISIADQLDVSVTVSVWVRVRARVRVRAEWATEQSPKHPMLLMSGYILN